MALNEFVYDPDGKSNSTLFNLTKGTFTFVAGKIAKTGDMKIDTPSPPWAFEAPRHTSKFRMTGPSNFPPSSKRARASSRKRPGRPRRSNSNRARSQVESEHLSGVLGICGRKPFRCSSSQPDPGVRVHTNKTALCLVPTSESLGWNWVQAGASSAAWRPFSSCCCSGHGGRAEPRKNRLCPEH